MSDTLLDLYRHYYNLWLVLLGVSLLGACAGPIGCFAVLRRRALTGDALAHAALPGLCVAYLVVGERHLPSLLLGALAAGLLGVAVIAALRRWTRVKEDAAIGAVLSVFFGAGVVLSQMIQHRPGGSRAGLESYILGSTAGMAREDLFWISALALLTLLAVLLLYKEFRLIAYDPAFAQAQGWPVYRLDLLLMGLLALAVVIGLPAVGVLMIAALLIVPAAAARFWTERLSRMLVIAAALGALAGAAGTVLSFVRPNLPSGATIILVCTSLFLLSAVLAPGRGVVAQALAARRFRRELRRGRTAEAPAQ